MRVLLGFALCACMTGCAARAPVGPAWPQAVAGDGDGGGGESLAPRAAARAIAAVAEDDRPVDRAAAEKPAAAAPEPASADRPSVTAAAPAAGPSEDAMTTEEIVIEVED